MAKRRTYRDDVTDPAEQRALFESVELRAARQAAKLAELPPPKKPLRGRGRPALVGSDVLPLTFAPISGEALMALDQALVGKRPVLDQLSRGNWVTPLPEIIERYVTAPNRRNGRLKTAQTPEQRKLIRANMQRQVQEVSDKLVKNSFLNLKLAQQRGAAVEVVRFQLWHGVEPDSEAVAIAADAVEDFGHALADKQNRGILESTGHVELADQLISLGQRATTGPTELNTYPEVLAMVAQEQAARAEAWGDLYAVAESTLLPSSKPTRLTQIDLLRAEEIDEQIVRFEGLLHAPAS